MLDCNIVAVSNVDMVAWATVCWRTKSLQSEGGQFGRVKSKEIILYELIIFHVHWLTACFINALST